MAAKPKRNPLDAVLDVDTTADEPRASSRKAPTAKRARSGKVLIGAHVSPPFSKAVKLIAVQEDTTTQALVEEALRLLLKSRNVTPPA